MRGTGTIITWQLTTEADGIIFEFNVLANTLIPTTVLSASFEENLSAEGNLNPWIVFAPDINGVPGILIDNEKKTLTFTENLRVPNFSGDELGFTSGDKLHF